MRRNIDGIALFFIVVALLFVESVVSHVAALPRIAAWDSLRCPEVAVPAMPRVELPVVPQPGR